MEESLTIVAPTSTFWEGGKGVRENRGGKFVKNMLAECAKICHFILKSSNLV